MVINSKESFAKNCNRGIKSAKGKYICLLNDDTIVRDGWLDKLVEVLDTNEQFQNEGGIASENISEEKDTEIIESSLNKIENVSSTNIEDYRRAFG